MKIIINNYEVYIKAKSIFTPQKRCNKKDTKSILHYLCFVLAQACMEAKRKNPNLIDGYYKDLNSIEYALRKSRRIEQ